MKNAIIAAVVAALIALGGASAATDATSTWTNAQLTSKVERLQTKNTQLRQDLRHLTRDYNKATSLLLCASEWSSDAPPQIVASLNENRDGYCGDLKFYSNAGD